MSTSPRLTLDAVLRQSREYRDITVQPPKLTLFERVRFTVAYASVAAGIGVACFYVTPSHARDVGVMNHEARVIVVSPSISVYGSKIEQKLRADIARDNNKAVINMQLEDQRSVNRRALEADKAYYKKLEWQRKNSK